MLEDRMVRMVAGIVSLVLVSGAVFGGSSLDAMLKSELYSQEVPVDMGLYDEVPSNEKTRKSLPKAVFLSILLPGAGEYYVGRHGVANAFWLAEGAVWAGYLSFTWHGKRVRDDYKLYAVSEAGANPEIDSEVYYDGLESYRTSEAYNEEVRRRARSITDPEERERYIEENSYAGEDGWSWDEEAWEEYASMRSTSRNSFLRAGYCTGAAVLNRVISAIVVARLTREHNAQLEKGSSRIDLRFEPELEEPGIRVVLRYTY